MIAFILNVRKLSLWGVHTKKQVKVSTGIISGEGSFSSLHNFSHNDLLHSCSITLDSWLSHDNGSSCHLSHVGMILATILAIEEMQGAQRIQLFMTQSDGRQGFWVTFLTPGDIPFCAPSSRQHENCDCSDSVTINKPDTGGKCQSNVFSSHYIPVLLTSAQSVHLPFSRGMKGTPYRGEGCLADWCGAFVQKTTKVFEWN